jgi:hypothetical protein
MPPAFMRDHPEQVQSVGMIGEHLSVKILGPVAPSRLVMDKGLPKIAGDLARPPGVTSISWGSHA